MTLQPMDMTTDRLLNGIDSELKRCLDLLLRIEEEVLPLVSHPIAPTLRVALQDIDLLSQCIDDISRCVRGLQTTEIVGKSIDVRSVLATIRLQDMKCRLEGGTYDSRKLVKRDEMFELQNPSLADHQLF